MKFYEKLPNNCPPETAYSPRESYFRLGSIPPDDSDFWSHRRRFPNKVFNVHYHCLFLIAKKVLKN